MEYKKLGEICNILNGYAFKSERYSVKGYRIIRIKNVQKGLIVDDDPKFYSLEEMEALKKYELFEDDILISLTGNVGRVGIIGKNMLPSALNQRVACLRLKNKDVNIKYLFSWLNSDKFEKSCIANSNGIAQKNLSSEFLKSVLITIPKLETQKKIVDDLEKAQALINARKEQIRLMDELIQSRFVEMFGDLAFNEKKWGSSKLVELCKSNDDIKCGPFGTQLSKEEYQKEGVPLWGIPQINSFFSIMPKDFLSEEKANQLRAYSIVPGDIVMSRKGNVGKCAIYPSDFPIGIMHSDALRIRAENNNINSQFLMHQLHNSRYVVNQIENVSGGAIMAGVNVTKLKKINVHVPPIVIQNQFAAFVHQVGKLKLEMQNNLDEINTTYQALMHHYFG